MEYKSNLKYFKQNTKPMVFGGILIVLGVIMKIAFRNERSWEMRQIYTLLLLAGAICIVLYFVIRPKDSELEEQIRRFTADDEETAKAKVMAADKRCRIIETLTVGDYIREHDGLIIFRGTDGTVRTNRYSSAVMLLTTERLYVYRRLFSIVAEDVTEEFLSFDYAAVKSCNITNETKEYTFGKRTAVQELSWINITSGDSTLSIAAHPDSFVDDFCVRLNRRIDSAKAAGQKDI